jgi:cysteine synthase
MTDTNPPAVQEPNSEEAERIAARVRRLMLISAATTGVAIAAVAFAVVYKVVRSEPATTAIAEQTAMLPRGAKIVSTAVAGDRLVVTVDIAGATEIRTFDARTLKPAGRLSFANSP